VQVKAGDQPVDGVEAHVSFDPQVLTVVDADGNGAEEVTGVTGVLDTEIQNHVDNAAGTIDYGAGSLSGEPASGTFDLAHIRFKALRPAAASDLSFVAAGGRKSDVAFQGTSVLGELVDGEVTVAGQMRVHLPLVLRGVGAPAVGTSPRAELSP
jgi:hypothetical protein